ncbi:Rab28 family GTPase [Phytophthora megakarya]|uniref:Rab28 family GTPase n=1 Tax=Phytophthora megakarya TaxID=4795 RepID=A0A225VR45_9STRA|nr:Rab28 family GTPase [Phytophthora megakarya]
MSKCLFGVHVALLCYDVTDAQSFSDVEDWLRVARENGGKQMNSYLVVKSDRPCHLKTEYHISAVATNIQASEFELSFCDKVVRSLIPDSRNGDQGEQEARTAMADEIETEVSEVAADPLS